MDSNPWIFPLDGVYLAARTFTLRRVPRGEYEGREERQKDTVRHGGTMYEVAKKKQRGRLSN